MKVTILTLCFFIIFLNFANAGEIYKCTDRDGNKIITDNIQDGMTKCVLMQSYEAQSPQEETQLPEPVGPPATDYGGGYVDAPIAYGRPFYYTPPVIVQYPYDYFTYELVGAYIDIVFWRNGHRYRNEHWYEHGRRVGATDLRSNQLHYRISAAELASHREKLQQHYNISHSNSSYGSKSISKQQIPRSTQQTEQRTQLVQRLPQQTKQKPQGGQVKTQQGKLRQAAPQQTK
jgi:hypothetical protein